MSDRDDIIKSIQEELAMHRASGSGVQDSSVSAAQDPSDSTSEKNIKLDGKGSEVGGNAGGVTSGGKAAAGGDKAMDKADGKSVESPDAEDCGCGDGADHVESNGDAGTGAKESEGMDQKGNGVQAKNVGKSKNSMGGTREKMDHVGGKGVASHEVGHDGMENGGLYESRVIELPHDTLVEDNGEQKVLPRGTKVVIEMVDDGKTPEPHPWEKGSDDDDDDSDPIEESNIFGGSLIKEDFDLNNDGETEDDMVGTGEGDMGDDMGDDELDFESADATDPNDIAGLFDKLVDGIEDLKAAITGETAEDDEDVVDGIEFEEDDEEMGDDETDGIDYEEDDGEF